MLCLISKRYSQIDILDLTLSEFIFVYVEENKLSTVDVLNQILDSEVLGMLLLYRLHYYLEKSL